MSQGLLVPIERHLMNIRFVRVATTKDANTLLYSLSALIATERVLVVERRGFVRLMASAVVAVTACARVLRAVDAARYCAVLRIRSPK
jgi:hypothetical protein